MDSGLQAERFRDLPGTGAAASKPSHQSSDDAEEEAAAAAARGAAAQGRGGAYRAVGFSYDREASPESGGPGSGTAAAPPPPPAQQVQQAQQAVPEPGPGEPPFLAPFPVPDALQGALPATDRHFKVRGRV